MAPIEPTVIAPGVPHPAVLFPNTPCPAQHGGAFLCVLRRAKEKPHCAAGQGVFLGGTSPGYQGDRARGSRGIYLRGRQATAPTQHKTAAQPGEARPKVGELCRRHDAIPAGCDTQCHMSVSLLRQATSVATIPMRTEGRIYVHVRYLRRTSRDRRQRCKQERNPERAPQGCPAAFISGEHR